MSLSLYTINDIIEFSFLKLPKALFVNPKYKAMSSDAKLTYSLLYDRLGLSKQNGWINENDEVFLIYTREEVANLLGVTYKKAMSAFRELLANGLIFEKRCGRGMANRIYIVKPEVVANQARDYDETRTADTEVHASADPGNQQRNDGDFAPADVPKRTFKHSCFGSSETAAADVQELPNRKAIKTDYNKTYMNPTEKSQSVPKATRNDDDDLQEILENCQLECFNEETQITFRDAIERLWYCERFKVGDAVLPQANVRSRLRNLEYTMLESALHHLRQNKTRSIKNITAYVMSTIFNCVTEEFSLLVVDSYLNQIKASDSPAVGFAETSSRGFDKNGHNAGCGGTAGGG